MCSLKPTLVLMLLFFNTAWMVNAGLYVINPLRGAICQANQPCIVTWLEDGRAPLLSSIGVSTVGLHTGSQQLVQSIQPVNVANERSLTFTPIPEAGPDSDNYYISFASTTLTVNGSTYIGYSAFFRLTGMSGSFNSPLPAATSAKPIPSSLTLQNPSTTSTITVGTLLSTPSLQGSTTSTTSVSSSVPRFTTSFSSSSSSSSSSTSSPSSSPSPPLSPADENGTIGLTSSTILLPSSLLISILLSWFLRML